MKAPENRKNWNEFEWEREFRRDENRIHYYFKVLPYFLDLPGEEDIILKKMKLNPELVSQNDNWDDIAPSLFYDDYEEEQFFLNDDWAQKDNAKLYLQLVKLASQWNILFASELKATALAAGLHITCLYGRALAYAAEMIDADDEENITAFMLCLEKRLHRELNRIIGKLHELAALQPELKDQLDSYVNHLQSIREKLLDLLFQTRKTN